MNDNFFVPINSCVCGVSNEKKQWTVVRGGCELIVEKDFSIPFFVVVKLFIFF